MKLSEKVKMEKKEDLNAQPKPNDNAIRIAPSISKGKPVKPYTKETFSPDPLEEDSDPDFNPGAYIPEPPKKVGKGKKSTIGIARKKGKGGQCSVTSDTDDDREPQSIKVTTPRVRHQNPLLEFFGDLGLYSASEEGEDAEDEAEEDQPSETDEDEPNRPIPRTLAVLLDKETSRSRSQSQSRTSNQQVTPLPEDESVTEPESDEEVAESPAVAPATAGPSQDRKRKPLDPNLRCASGPPAKKSKLSTIPPAVNEDSLTEPESATEPESDTDEGHQFETRPAFLRKPEQPALGPMVLDAERKIQVPRSINTFLRDYQREGITFLWERYQDRRGGLLGDDMGLGKTIQVISFLAAIMRKTGDSRDADRRRKHVSLLQDTAEWKKRRKLPFANSIWPTALIIAPSSVVPNWQREFETWGFFEVGVYSTVSDRKDVLKDFKLGRLDIVITSFDLARRDIDLIDSLAWSVIIIDEAHRVKNPRSKLTIAFDRFKCNCRLGLTGTAIQNDYAEFWTILNWTNPGALGTPKQWEGFVVRPLTKGQSKSATPEERVTAVAVARILKEKLLPKYFLRRTKALIRDQLPEKIDQVVFCPLTATQIDVYKRILRTESVQDVIRKDDPCDCGSKKRRWNCCHKIDKGALFRYMSALIKISNHLALILPSPNDTPEQMSRNRELSEEAFQGDPIPRYGPAMLLPQLCGKWLVLETLLKEWRKDLTNKVLIFTKSVKLLEMLEFHLQSQSLSFVKLDGSTKQSDRMPIIDRFHDEADIFVFLISTLAGGTGLNLTGANKVVIFDPNWNPAHDLQAMDRAYRYGQARDVEVFRLLGAGSLEELIYARQVYKQQQMAVGYDASLQTRYFEGVQGDKGKQGELFGIKNIFKLHEDTLATKHTIERANLLDLDWALSNMDVQNIKSKKPDSTRWVYEEEAKENKEYGELRGLGALLFDDDTPDIKKDDDVRKALSNIGVKYTHRNEDLIAENIFEVQRIKALKEVQKKARTKTKARAAASDRKRAVDPEWPPKRKHHRALPAPQEKLVQRKEALLELGIISSPQEIGSFALDFLQKPPEEQAQLLAQLDSYPAKFA